MEKITPVYLTEKDVSILTSLALSTLRNARFNRTGIPYLRVGKRAVRYKYEDVVRFMEKNRIDFER